MGWDTQIPSHESVEAGGVVFGSLELRPSVILAANAKASISQSGSGPDVKRVKLQGSLLLREQAPAGGAWEVFALANGTEETVFPDVSSEYSRQQPLRVDDVYCEVPAGGLTSIEIGLRHASVNGDPITVLLPCLVLEAIELDESVTGVQVENRFPYPDQEYVPWDLSEWRFDLTDYDGDPPPSSVIVIVNGVTIHNGGTDFFGVTTLSSTATRTSVSIVPDGTGPFASPGGKAEWTIQVQATGVDESWSFTVTNSDSPAIASARFLSGRELEIQFSEDMEDGEDVLEPGAYSLYPEIVPAYPPTTTEVSALDSRTLVVTFDDNVTFGVPYRLTVASSVTDSSGKTLDIDNREYVVGPATHIRDRVLNIFEEFPEFNRNNDEEEELWALSKVMQDVFDQIYYSLDSWEYFLDPTICPEDYLDRILQDLGNPFTFTMTVAEKRLLALELSQLLELVGTEPGIEAAVLLFTGIEVEVVTRADSPAWILGDSIRSILGVSTIVAPPTTSERWMTIWLRLPPGMSLEDLTETQVQRAEGIVTAMFPENAKFGGIIEAS